MASLQERNGSFRFIFRYHGKQHFVPIGKVPRNEAEAKAAQVEYLLLRLKQQLIALPPGVGIAEFLQHDGKPPAAAHPAIPSADLTLAGFRDRYLSTHRESLEERTIEGIELHFRHLVAAMGDQFPIRQLKLHDLQAYVDRRIKAKTKTGKRLSPATVKKEIISLRTAWNWAEKMELVAGRFPYHGLRYPKTDEKPPFQTMEEIERRIAAGGSTVAEQKELWECLYLRTPEIAALLDHVREHARYGWIFPLICMAAHTGARRSELLRIEITDVDFAGGSVVIREKKRVKGKRSTRRAPLTPLLADALKQWLAVHPGGTILFCHPAEVTRSKKRSGTTGYQTGGKRPTTQSGRHEAITRRANQPQIGPLTASECHDHFRRTLRGSRWQVVRGLHVLRHSVASCLAAAGIDQRIIDDILGHQSLEMQRRYRHLTPQVKGQAVISVFG